MSDTTIKVLIIDDDDGDRMLLRRVLASSGLNASIVEAIDAQAGLAHLKDEHFDIAFCDYLLPDDNGLAVLGAARAAGIATPIIMLTGHGAERLAVDLIKAGASEYLHKGKLTAETLLHSLTQVKRLDTAEQDCLEAERRLEEANKQLLHSEKMAALGQKPTGVAQANNQHVRYE